jgi:thiosulfate/3-mercaptopyruvate sulfurtransferase
MPTPTQPDLGDVPPIVDADWLQARLAPVVVCEVGSTMAGRDPFEAYQQGHLAGARYVSLDEVLAAPPRGIDGRHPLPEPADFALALGELGVAATDVVVAYDRAGGGFAGRLVWMLRIIGQPAALLDGGFAVWEGPIETGEHTVGPVERSVFDWPTDALADADEVAAHVHDGGVVIDSRDPRRYAGEMEPIDAVAGHVPGAINLFYTDNLDAEGRFRPTQELADRFTAARGDDRAIVYCGSGVTACHNALAMEHAGLPLPRVYVGSWSGWTADPERPVATGTTTPTT